MSREHAYDLRLSRRLFEADPSATTSPLENGSSVLSPTNSDTGTGEMLLIASCLSRTDKSPTVGEEGEGEEEEEE